MSAIDDHARLFPGGDEGASGGRAVELQNQIVDSGDQVHQSRHARFQFADERGAIGNLSARRVEQSAEGGDGSAEGADARRRHAASGGAGLRAGGLREVANECGGGDEGLMPQFHNL